MTIGFESKFTVSFNMISKVSKYLFACLFSLISERLQKSTVIQQLTTWAKGLVSHLSGTTKLLLTCQAGSLSFPLFFQKKLWVLCNTNDVSHVKVSQFWFNLTKSSSRFVCVPDIASHLLDGEQFQPLTRAGVWYCDLSLKLKFWKLPTYLQHTSISVGTILLC
jgi:hypothetical protein